MVTLAGVPVQEVCANTEEQKNSIARRNMLYEFVISEDLRTMQQRLRPTSQVLYTRVTPEQPRLQIVLVIVSVY
jgi:hypothetical protein